MQPLDINLLIIADFATVVVSIVYLFHIHVQLCMMEFIEMELPVIRDTITLK